MRPSMAELRQALAKMDTECCQRDRRLRPASVLVPLVAREDGISVLLIQRAESLSRHAGQIAFPGGILEDSDADDCAAALREAHEEIGLPEAEVDVFASLPPQATSTGFLIHPFVGEVSQSFIPVPDCREVDETFELPLASLARAEGYRQCIGHRQRRYLEIHCQGRRIWGATAAILHGMATQIGARECLR